jgi:hypothetical protein
VLLHTLLPPTLLRSQPPSLPLLLLMVSGMSVKL